MIYASADVPKYQKIQPSQKPTAAEILKGDGERARRKYIWASGGKNFIFLTKQKLELSKMTLMAFVGAVYFGRRLQKTVISVELVMTIP